MSESKTTTLRTTRAELNLSRLSLLLGMLVFQLGIVFVRPMVAADGVGTRWFDLVFAALIFSALWAVSHSSWERNVAVVLAIGAMALGSYGRFLDEVSPALLSSLALGALFFLFVAVVLLRAILRVRRVNGHVLSGACCVYLLFGMAFALLYGLVAAADDTSFPNLEKAGTLAETYFAYLADYQYFSFVTLTTLGYGDISPTDNLSRGLAVVEAVLGQLFLAILVARLVGLQIATQTLEAGSQGQAAAAGHDEPEAPD